MESPRMVSGGYFKKVTVTKNKSHSLSHSCSRRYAPLPEFVTTGFDGIVAHFGEGSGQTYP
jgi:hypothetical protein